MHTLTEVIHTGAGVFAWIGIGIIVLSWAIFWNYASYPKGDPKRQSAVPMIVLLIGAVVAAMGLAVSSLTS